MAQSYTRLKGSCCGVSVVEQDGDSANYHLIWCPKYRRPVLADPVEARLKETIGSVVAECGGEVIEVEVMPDHVHLFVEVPPAIALSGLVEGRKGHSWRLLRQAFPDVRRLRALWSPSWFVSTVGGAPLDVARRYIESQRRVA